MLQTTRDYVSENSIFFLFDRRDSMVGVNDCVYAVSFESRVIIVLNASRKTKRLRVKIEFFENVTRGLRSSRELAVVHNNICSTDGSCRKRAKQCENASYIIIPIVPTTRGRGEKNKII